MRVQRSSIITFLDAWSFLILNNSDTLATSPCLSGQMLKQPAHQLEQIWRQIQFVLKQACEARVGTR